MRLARGFLQEAEQVYELHRWRSCVDNAQMSVEHAARAILAGTQLRNLIEGGRLVGAATETMKQLIESFDAAGGEKRFLTRDGDEAAYRDPWSLFGESDARRGLEAARECASGAARIFEGFLR